MAEEVKLLPDDIQSKNGANGTLSDIWSLMAKQCPADAVRMKHCRGCIHLKALDKRGYTAYCAYMDDTDRRRPCTFGTDPCLGKELLPGFQPPSDSQHKADIADAVNRVRKKTEPKKRGVRGRPISWDTEYAKRLYLTGEYYFFEIAEIVGATTKQVSNFVYSRMWRQDRIEQLREVAKVRHNMDEGKAKYEAWKEERKRNNQSV